MEEESTEPTTIPIVPVRESGPPSSRESTHPSSKSDPPIPKDSPRFIKHLMAWANASKGPIAAVAALITAMGAFFKPQDHSVTKTAYDTLSASITQIAEGQKRDHDDVVALRGYLDGLTRAGVPQSPAPIASSAEPAAPAAPRHGRLGGGSRHQPPPPVASARVAEVEELLGEQAAPAPVLQAQEIPAPAAPVSVPPLPPVHDEMRKIELPGFDAIMRR